MVPVARQSATAIKHIRSSSLLDAGPGASPGASSGDDADEDLLGMLDDGPGASPGNDVDDDDLLGMLDDGPEICHDCLSGLLKMDTRQSASGHKVSVCLWPSNRSEPNSEAL